MSIILLYLDCQSLNSESFALFKHFKYKIDSVVFIESPRVSEFYNITS